MNSLSGTRVIIARAVEKNPLLAHDVLKLGAEKDETRHGECLRRDDALRAIESVAY